MNNTISDFNGLESPLQDIADIGPRQSDHYCKLFRQRKLKELPGRSSTRTPRASPVRVQTCLPPTRQRIQPLQKPAAGALCRTTRLLYQVLLRPDEAQLQVGRLDLLPVFLR